MKQVLVYPRFGIQRIIDSRINLFHSPWALIAIWGTTSNDDEFLNDSEVLDHSRRKQLEEIGCQQTLSLCFDDVTPNVCDGYRLFSKGQARLIVGFLEAVRELDTLVIHCQAGISRSGAVGLYSCRYYGLSEREFIDMNPRIMPNHHVLSILSSIYNPLFESK